MKVSTWQIWLLCFLSLLFLFPPFSFQSREQGIVSEETSCWNALHQCGCSSADLCAAVCAACTIFHITVVWNRLCSAHPSNRKVGSIYFPAFCKDSSLSHPQWHFVLESWSVGEIHWPFLHENSIQITPQAFLWLNVTIYLFKDVLQNLNNNHCFLYIKICVQSVWVHNCPSISFCFWTFQNMLLWVMSLQKGRNDVFD